MQSFLIITLLGLLYVGPSIQVPTGSLKFSLYYESLCPYCMQFLTEQLYPAYHKIGSYIQLELVPYGNIHQEKVNGSWVFNCQHGPQECAINKIEACGLARSNDPAKIMEFVYCVESQAKTDPENLKLVAQCASKIGFTGNEILKCSQGAEGNELLAKLGRKQRKLNPTIQYVPWLLFNDKHDPKMEDKARNNFLQTACELLSHKPSGCFDNDQISVIEYNDFP